MSSCRNQPISRLRRRVKFSVLRCGWHLRVTDTGWTQRRQPVLPTKIPSPSWAWLAPPNTGVVDPIAALADIAVDKGIALHVDAAFGGLVLPFLPEAPPLFDFQLDGVTSISVDPPHKMGMSTIPVGCLLTRDPSMLCSLNVDTPYLTVKQEFTLAGTRSGGAVAGALAVIEHLGRDGFTTVVAECMANHRRLTDGMAALGYPVLAEPEVNVAAFDCPLSPEGWQVSRTRHGHMRIVCMPHITTTIIEEFLKDIGDMHV